jgi:hypothetical protein
MNAIVDCFQAVTAATSITDCVIAESYEMMV